MMDVLSDNEVTALAVFAGNRELVFYGDDDPDLPEEAEGMGWLHRIIGHTTQRTISAVIHPRRVIAEVLLPQRFEITLD